MNARIVTAAEISRDQVDAFLRQVYTDARCDFLWGHGDWWHGGPENRWLLVVDGEIAGYCAVIPTQVELDGAGQPALWWVDLVIAPAYRGRGLQTMFDEKIRDVADLKLGFPNELAAAIHRKHGWVVREDLQVRLLPLRPRQLRQVKNRGGLAGLALKAAALGIAPLAWLRRRSAQRYRPRSARVVQDPDPQALAGIFERHPLPGIWTTTRSSDFFRWRYLGAPYRDQLHFYLAGPQRQPSHYLVARHMEVEGTRVVRILDAFGGLEDMEGFRDVLQLCLKNAASWGAVQVTMLDSLPLQNRVFVRQGFIIRATARFCGHADDPGTMIRLEQPGYWSLADSDNDVPG